MDSPKPFHGSNASHLVWKDEYIRGHTERVKLFFSDPAWRCHLCHMQGTVTSADGGSAGRNGPALQRCFEVTYKENELCAWVGPWGSGGRLLKCYLSLFFPYAVVIFHILIHLCTVVVAAEVKLLVLLVLFSVDVSYVTWDKSGTEWDFCGGLHAVPWTLLSCLYLGMMFRTTLLSLRLLTVASNVCVLSTPNQTANSILPLIMTC